MQEKAEKKRWPRWKKLLVGFGAAFTLAWLLPFLYVCARLAYKGHCTRQYRQNEPAAHPGSVWVCQQPYIWLEVQERADNLHGLCGAGRRKNSGRNGQPHERDEH